MLETLQEIQRRLTAIADVELLSVEPARDGDEVGWVLNGPSLPHPVTVRWRPRQWDLVELRMVLLDEVDFSGNALQRAAEALMDAETYCGFATGRLGGEPGWGPTMQAHADCLLTPEPFREFVEKLAEAARVVRGAAAAGGQ